MTIFTSHDNCYTFNRFFKDCGRALQKEMPFIFYADLAFYKKLPHNTALFTDLERLDTPRVELAIAAENALKAAGARVLNPPSRVLRRYDLLQKLYQSGINEFRAYRLHEDRSQLRFPAFLRYEREHQGNLTPLLHNSNEVEAAIIAARLAGHADDNLLLMEYCDVQDADGLYRKYSAFMIGKHSFARHLIANRNWMSKGADPIYANEENCIQQENHYMTEFPHQAKVRELFVLAGIDYGRIDYSFKNGRIQVWEINTNPNIIPEGVLVPGRRAAQEQVHQNVADALQALREDSPPPAGQIPFTVPADLKTKLHIDSLDSMLHPLRRQLRPVRPERVRRFVKGRLPKLYSVFSPNT